MEKYAEVKASNQMTDPQACRLCNSLCQNGSMEA